MKATPDSKTIEGYTKSWTPKFPAAFDSFRENLAKAAKTKYDEKPDEYWSKYGLLTRSATDRPDTIERRHQFFVEKMHAFINPQLKDPSRIFGEVEKQLIYYRDRKRCQVPGCGAEVTWAEAEFHHVKLHSQGGFTILDNGALVHKDCHPKNTKAVDEFADHWRAKLEKQRSDATAGSGTPPAVTTDGSGAQPIKRGRPKLPVEEKLVARLLKLGLTPEHARDSVRKLLEESGKA